MIKYLRIIYKAVSFTKFISPRQRNLSESQDKSRGTETLVLLAPQLLGLKQLQRTVLALKWHERGEVPLFSLTKALGVQDDSSNVRDSSSTSPLLFLPLPPAPHSTREGRTRQSQAKFKNL